MVCGHAWMHVVQIILVNIYKSDSGALPWFRFTVPAKLTNSARSGLLSGERA